MTRICLCGQEIGHPVLIVQIETPRQPTADFARHFISIVKPPKINEAVEQVMLAVF